MKRKADKEQGKLKGKPGHCKDCGKKSLKDRSYCGRCWDIRVVIANRRRLTRFETDTNPENFVSVWCPCGRGHRMHKRTVPYREEARRAVLCPTCREGKITGDREKEL